KHQTNNYNISSKQSSKAIASSTLQDNVESNNDNSGNDDDASNTDIIPYNSSNQIIRAPTELISNYNAQQQLFESTVQSVHNRLLQLLYRTRKEGVTSRARTDESIQLLNELAANSTNPALFQSLLNELITS